MLKEVVAYRFLVEVFLKGTLQIFQCQYANSLTFAEVLYFLCMNSCRFEKTTGKLSVCQNYPLNH